MHVTFKPLAKEDYRRILTQPENALIRQYQLLLRVDNVELSFDDSALDAIAEHAFEANENSENIGARRLHTVLERILSDVAFNAGDGDAPQVNFVVDANYVQSQLQDAVKERDLKKIYSLIALAQLTAEKTSTINKVSKEKYIPVPIAGR